MASAKVTVQSLVA